MAECAQRLRMVGHEVLGQCAICGLGPCLAMQKGAPNVAENLAKSDVMERLEYCVGPWSDYTLADDVKFEINRLRAALMEISKGEGAFSRDPLTFANNTIENMKQIALDALAK